MRITLQTWKLINIYSTLVPLLKQFIKQCKPDIKLCNLHTNHTIKYIQTTTSS